MAQKGKGFVENIKGLIKHYRQGGIQEVVYRLSSYGYLPEWLLFLESTNIMVLEKFNEKAIRRKLTKYEFKVADESNIKDIIDCTGNDSPENAQEIFQNFFDEGHKCILIKDGTKTVAYAWSFTNKYILTFDDYKSNNITILAGEGNVFFGTGFIAEEYRLKGLFPHMIKYMMDQFPDSTKYYTAIDHGNAPSYQSHCRLGYVPLFSVISFSLLMIRTYFVKREEDKLRSFEGFGSPTLELSNYVNQE